MEFKKIDKSNYWDCINLQVDKVQEHFVADNKQSLVEAAYEEELYTLGIYENNTMVGFLKYIKEKHRAEKIYISVSLENSIARKMYRELGFDEIKEIEYTFLGVQYREMQMIKEL